MRRQGKNEEAYTYLKELYPQLTDEVGSGKFVVLERIRELEVTLKIPFWKRFKAEDAKLGAPDKISLEQRAILLEQGLEQDSADK